VNSFCPIAKRITFAQLAPAERAAAQLEGRRIRDEGNEADSDETVRQVRDHNSVISCVCDNDCPTKPADQPTN
jgi:hypothetical protein